MNSLGAMFHESFVQSAIQSNRLLMFAQNVVSKWENISVKFADSMTMIPRRDSFIAMIVVFVELVVGRDSFTARSVRTASCYSVDLRGNHLCIENSMKNQCPICYEYLFDSVQSTTIMKCGHTMHLNCFNSMLLQNQYRCPICSKSVHDMSMIWEGLDEEIEATPMPEDYHYKVPILCNDCNVRSEAFFHIFGHKCCHCNSYNTRVISS